MLHPLDPQPHWRPPRLFKRPELMKGDWQFWRWSEAALGNRLSFTRFTFWRTPWFRIMVHWYNDAENGVLLHNHWSWLLAFILRGRYIEEREDRGRRWLRVIQFINWIPQRVFHRIAAVKPGTISLVLTGPNKHTVEWIE